jgi:hypothetical protein
MTEPSNRSSSRCAIHVREDHATTTDNATSGREEILTVDAEVVIIGGILEEPVPSAAYAMSPN